MCVLSASVASCAGMGQAFGRIRAAVVPVMCVSAANGRSFFFRAMLKRLLCQPILPIVLSVRTGAPIAVQNVGLLLETTRYIDVALRAMW